MSFTESIHCRSRAHCKSCRSNAEWRKAVSAPDECPYGVTGLGDLVAKVTTAIGIKKCGGCAKRQAVLNRVGYKILGFFKKLKSGKK